MNKKIYKLHDTGSLGIPIANIKVYLDFQAYISSSMRLCRSIVYIWFYILYEVCKSLHLDDDFLTNAYELRNKYFSGKQGELSRKTSPYDSKKISSMCELCEKELSSEIHHIEYQKFVNNNGFIEGFHENHLGNLLSVCE